MTTGSAAKIDLTLPRILKTRTLNQVINLYDQVSYQLHEAAKITPNPSDDSDFDDDMDSLIDAREDLVDLALKMKVQCLDDVNTLLALWTKISVHERTDEDLTRSDELVLAVQKFLGSKTDLI